MADLTYKFVHLIRKYADEHPKLKQLVKSQVMCGCSFLPVKGEQQAVYLLSNGKRAIFIGNSSCKNAWTCPKCAVKKARTACIEISGIIETMKLRGLVPVMMTLTVPHSKNQKAEFSVDVLYTAWRKFKNGKRINVTSKAFDRSGNPFSRCCRDLGISHWYYAAEATYGDNGWHPHFHVLLFLPKKNVKRLGSYESQLRRYWFKTVLRCMLERWKNDGKSDSRAEFLRRRIIEQRNAVSRPLFLSKDGNGNVAVVSAANYLAGVSASNAAFELSSIHLKESRVNGHFTSFEVLKQAYDCYVAKDNDGFNLWMSRYFELMIATKFRRKFNHSYHAVSMSAVQIAKIKQAYIESGLSKYRCVTWFTAAEFAALSYLERREPVFASLIEIAENGGDEADILSYIETLGFKLMPRAQNDFVRIVEDMANNVPDRKLTLATSA